MKRHELRNWSEMLEAGLGGEPTLELARELSHRRPINEKPSSTFVEELRATLLHLPDERVHASPGWTPAIVISGIVALILFVLFLQNQPVSAAEVFEQANRHYAALAGRAGVLHTEFTLSYNTLDPIDRTTTDRYDWRGELWQDLSNSDFRYQLVDREGNFHYFAQRSGDRFWRSAYSILASKGDLIYALTEDQFYAQDNAFSSGIAPIFGDVIDWLELDSWWLSQAVVCENPFCSLGLADNDLWMCEGSNCSFHLSSAIGDIPATEVGATWIGEEILSDGKQAEVVEIRHNIDQDLVRQLKVDSSTYELVEIIAYQRNEEVARMTFQQREVLNQGPFTSLPAQLKAVSWEGEDVPPAPRLGPVPFPSAPRGSVPAVWPRLANALPSAGKTLKDQTQLVLFVVMPPELQEDVDLVVTLCEALAQTDPASAISNCVGLAGDTAHVPAGGGTVRISIPIHPDGNWPEAVWVMLKLIYPDGQSVSMIDPEFFWIVEQ